MLPVVEYARLNEVQTYCAMTRHVWDGLSVLVNAAAWKGLPERLQNVVSNAFNGAAMRQREDSKKMEETARASLTKAGMKFNDVDNASFRDLLRRHGHYARIRDKIGNQAWSVVQKTTGVTA
jgi:TRAP-type C4-dicarboxylate transport system substrate-binding protein